MGRKGASRHRFALPNPRRTIPPAIFQTVSLERLSGNSERAPLRGLTSLRNRTKGHHLDASRYRKTRDPTRAASFQTVSPETVWKLRIGSITRSHEPAERANEHLFGAWRHRKARDRIRPATFQTVSPRTSVNIVENVPYGRCALSRHRLRLDRYI